MNADTIATVAAGSEPAGDDIHLLACGATPVPAPGPDAVGGKAHNLMRMAALGLPVPPAFVIGTAWSGRHQQLDSAIWQGALQAVERETGLAFGNPRRPLLLSVRSGAPVSMPGMMETLLDIGLCDATLPGLLRLTGDPRLAWDSYRRLVAGYGETVAGIAATVFEADLRAVAGTVDERDLGFAELRELTQRHLATFRSACGQPFPQDPRAQLQAAIGAVFDSWQAPKAAEYRRLKGIDDAVGTAVTVQRMVFGNAGGISGAGVGFTRDPAAGTPQPWVDFLFNAQGEDVVAGRRRASGHGLLAASAPTVWQQIESAMARLEAAFGDMQDFEFTIERGVLFLLQTRDGKRTPLAEARIALDLLAAGIIDRDSARARTRALDRQALREVVLAAGDAAPTAALARAASACPGIASGEIALDAARAAARTAQGVPVVLVRRDAETADIAALHLACGLLTQRGARTSHAAVVARQLGKVCLVGCEDLQFVPERREISIGGRTLAEGDTITLDGNGGAVHAGRLEVVERFPEDLLARLAEL